jgi:hypothetical protein
VGNVVEGHCWCVVVVHAGAALSGDGASLFQPPSLPAHQAEALRRAQQARPSRTSVPTVERDPLYSPTKLRQKVETLENKRAEVELSGCTFRPQIRSRSVSVGPARWACLVAFARAVGLLAGRVPVPRGGAQLATVVGSRTST